MKELFKKYWIEILLIIVFAAFSVGSHYFSFEPGKEIFKDVFWMFIKNIIILLPLMFVLIGLIDVWIPQDRLQKHIGDSSGIKGVLLVMLLAFIQGGPLYLAFPVAYLLWKKGGSPVNVFIYLGAFTIVKIPMLTFEIGFLGLTFSMLRIFISIPIVVLIGIIMGKYFKRNNCRIKEV